MGPIPFRFENIWLEDPNFKKIIEKWWVDQNLIGWVDFRFMDKLKGMKGCIR